MARAPTTALRCSLHPGGFAVPTAMGLAQLVTSDCLFQNIPGASKTLQKVGPVIFFEKVSICLIRCINTKLIMTGELRASLIYVVWRTST